MRRLLAAAAALTFVPIANAAPAAQDKTAGSRLDVFYQRLDLEAKYQGDSESIDGNGGGMALWMGNGWGLFTAEFESSSLDGDVAGFDVDADARVWRVGMGAQFLNTPDAAVWLRGEYVDFNGDLDVEGLGEADDSQNGFAAHLGGRLGRGALNGYAEIGIVELDDLDGMEYKVGVNFQPGLVGGFIEYRVTDLETDNLGIDEEWEAIRIGVRVAFQ